MCITSLLFAFTVSSTIQEPKSVEVTKTPIANITYSPNGKLVSVAGMQGDIVIIEADTWKVLHRHKFSSSRVNTVTFNHDNSLLAVSSDDKNVRIITVEGQVKHTFTGQGPAGSVAFSPDGNKLVGIQGDGYFRAWDVKTGTELWKVSSEGRGGGNFVWSPKGDRIFFSSSGVGGTIYVMNPADGKTIANNNNHVGTVQFITFSKDGSMALASVARGGNNPALITMNGSTGATIHNFESLMVNGFFTPDNSLIVGLGGDGEMRVFDVNSKQRKYKGNPVMQFRFFIPSKMALSPDGKTALLAGDLGTEYGFYIIDVTSLK